MGLYVDGKLFTAKENHAADDAAKVAAENWQRQHAEANLQRELHQQAAAAANAVRDFGDLR